MGIELIYPTITLFLSDLRVGLGETSGRDSQQSRRLEKFLRKFKLAAQHKITLEEFNQLCDRATSNEISELIEPQIFPANHDGCHQPVQLDDTYCLISNYSGLKGDHNQSNYSPKLIDTLDKHWGLDYHLNLIESPTTLGETWLYQAQLANPTDQPDSIAQAIYQNIAKHSPDPQLDWQKDLKGQGIWQDGDIYELWVDQPTSAANLSSQIAHTAHILIWLMPANLKPQDADQRMRHSYQDLLYLCRYRHKILAAAHNSYALSADLKKDYSKITAYLQEMHQGIMTDRQLQEIMNSLTDFTYRLDLLKSQSQTIHTNQENYLQRLATIQRKAGSGENLEMFKTFIADDRYTPKYQKQITADYEQLAPSRDILQILSQTVQSSIQIRQTQVDRTTNITIASIATVLATSQVLSAVITTYKKNPKDPKQITELPISKGIMEDAQQYAQILITDPTLYVSLALSVLFGGGVFLALSMLQRFPYWWKKIWTLKRH